MKSRKEDLEISAAADLQYRQLEYASRSPLVEILRCSREVRGFADWPFPGKYRVAPHYFAQVYQSGKTGLQYARDWISAHHLDDCELAQELVANLMCADTALLYDGVNILNAASFEVIARRCYGLERAFELCSEPGDWHDETKGRVRLYLMDQYDLSHLMSTEFRIPSADLAVKREMQRREQLQKSFSKGGKSSSEAYSADPLF